MGRGWEVEIRKDGMWPFRWSWVVRSPAYISRRGEALTKDRAQRKAAEARVSMERDDLVLRDA